MTGLLENAGARSTKETQYAPLYIENFGSPGGLFTNRNPLIDPSSLYERRYLGGRPSTILGGLNTEVSVRNTIIRRPGLTAFSAATYPTVVQRAFSFEDQTGTIRVLVDTGSTGAFVVSSVATSVGATAVYSGTFTGGGSNAFVGFIFQVAGFNATNDNGTYTCTASTASTLTLSNSTATTESHAATATSAGAVYYDQQNGLKTLLKAKGVGAGQSSFVAVAGICYVGDGVDTWMYTPGNVNSTTWDWGVEAPAAQPSVTIVPSGAASVQWQASTVFSTMGLLVDSNGDTEQLNSVNSSLTNTTQFGTTGNGQPAFSSTPGATTNDNSVVWKNSGPIVAWESNKLWNNATIGGTDVNPCICYDPKTRACYIQSNPGQTQGTSGANYPAFKAGPGQSTQDGTVKWIYLGTGGIPGQWQPSHAYPKVGSVSNNDVVSSISVPVSLANGLPTNQVVYWQTVSTAGTSGVSGTAPTWSTLTGTTTQDGDNIWLNLGSATWAATTSYAGWSQSGTIFSAIKDSNNNMQVCTTTGASATVQPGTSFVLSAAGNASGGNTTYTGTFSPTIPVGAGNLSVVIASFSTSANNGTFTIVSCSATQLVVKNASGTSESHAATAVYNPWGLGYGATTSDGTAVWTNVGVSMSWAASTIWFLPTPGFNPPSSASPFGGASVIDSNSNVEFIVNSGKTAAVHPVWGAVGTYTAEGTALTLTQVAVSGTTTTYTGTITGGAANALVGKSYLIAGFTNAGNNVLINVTASTNTTLVCTTSSQVNETHAGTATGGNNPIWFDLEVFSSQSLAWTKGMAYAYSFKSRALDDFYSVADSTGTLPIPPGLSQALPAPSGSLTGDVSSASPAFIITGSNSGSVNTIAGFGSANPAVDTIVIWRSPDEASGSADMLELTEIPAPKPIGGIAQPWSFKDFLPDTPTADFPGLNVDIPAPINGVNDPPPSSAIPMEFNFERIWCANGQQVIFSGGPDTDVGNPQGSFNAADEFPFLSNVIRCVKSTQGLIIYTANSLEILLGGPVTSSFYSVTLAPGVGLGNYNALDVFAGEHYFLDTNGQLRVLSPTLSLTSAGFPIADQLMRFNPATAYIAFADLPNDTALYIGTGSTAYNGSTGYFRVNPRQIPGGVNGPEPVVSPFAAITGGCQLLQAVEVTPGTKKLLIGSTSAGQSISKRDTSVFTDNGTPYDSNFTVGSIWLTHRGEIALLKFVESDFDLTTTNPTVSYLLNEISGSFTSFVFKHYDPPSLYGTTITPNSYNPLRFEFAGQGSLARAVHLQIKFDFGTNSNPSEIFNFTLYGGIVKGQ